MSNLSEGSTASVVREAVDRLPDRPRRPAAPRLVDPAEAAPPQAASAPPQQIFVPQKPTVAELLHGAFDAIARVLAVRLQLLLALIGAFVLALGAMQWQSWAGLFVLIAWCCLAVLPLVWLEHGGRPRLPRG